MSDMLSEEQLSAMEDGTCIDLECRECDVTNRLIASHRALRTERDALKDDLATILKERNDLAMRCDALKAELADCHTHLEAQRQQTYKSVEREQALKAELAKMRQLLEIAKELIKHP